MPLVLYTRRGCHLCEQAEDMLLAAGVRPRLVDVDGDPVAAGHYGLRVPVLEADGRVIMEGRFDWGRLAAVISQAQIEAASGEGVDESGR